MFILGQLKRVVDSIYASSTFLLVFGDKSGTAVGIRCPDWYSDALLLIKFNTFSSYGRTFSGGERTTSCFSSVSQHDAVRLVKSC